MAGPPAKAGDANAASTAAADKARKNMGGSPWISVHLRKEMCGAYCGGFAWKPSAQEATVNEVPSSPDHFDVSPSQPATFVSRLAKHALEDRIDMLGVIAKVEEFGELGLRQFRRDILVGLEKFQEIAFAAPDRHGIALDRGIGFFARHALLRQRQHHAL